MSFLKGYVSMPPAAKLQRKFSMLAQGRAALHTFGSPLTCEFNIARQAFGNGNTAHFTIYNLDYTTRQDLRVDLPANLTGPRQITFSAGYKSLGGPKVCFIGNINRCCSYRVPGGTGDIVTDMECIEAAQAAMQAQVDLTVPAGWKFQPTVAGLVKLMGQYGVKPGYITDKIAINSTRGTTWVGSIRDVLNELAENGGYCFVDNGKIHLLKNGEVFGDPALIQLINADGGLLDTPRKFESGIEFKMLFEPSLILGQAVTVQDETAPEIDGQYQIQVLAHSGSISESRDGGAITTVKGWQMLQQAISYVRPETAIE